MMSDAEVVEAAVRDMPFYRRSGGGVTLGGGEPTFQPEFARAVLVRLKLHGVDTAIETCGCADGPAFLRIAELVDHILFDVKHADSRRHARLTGAGNESILSNLRAVVRVHRTWSFAIQSCPAATTVTRTWKRWRRFCPAFPACRRSNSCRITGSASTNTGCWAASMR
jgi:pyruvate-formate lyase-activating enzyme